MKSLLSWIGNVASAMSIVGVWSISAQSMARAEDNKDAAIVRQQISEMKVGNGDWPQWGGSHFRNNVASSPGIPETWDVDTGENVAWAMPLGSETYGNPVIANGKVYVGTNNGSGYLERFPNDVDLGVLLCFNEKDGAFLWQHSNRKLTTGRVHDWPNQGICSTPLVDGQRLWYVTSRGEVVCLDTEGFSDGKNDGVKDEESTEKNEADVLWRYNMMSELSVSQHNMCSCSVTVYGDKLFVCTGNGVDEGHIDLPSPTAPSFICLDKNTGKLLWADNSPGANVLHGQWSSPAYGNLGGVDQVLFGGGDGWLYGFDANGENGEAKLLWKFDCNPKDTLYELGGSATRNYIIATPVIYEGLVYVAVGEDPEYGEGAGHLWCVDPTKRGDVSPTLVFNEKDKTKPIAHKRVQALVAAEGDFERPNPNSAAVWHYVGDDPKEFETTMHRTCGTAAIKDGILFVADFSGMFHCLDAKTGQAYWTYDMYAASWASPLIVDDRVYISDEDGDIAIFKTAKKMELIDEINMGSAVYTSPVAANGRLYVAHCNALYALEAGAKTVPTP